MNKENENAPMDIAYLIDKRFSFSKERAQRNSKPQEKVSVRTLYTIANKKRHTNRSQSLN